MLVLDRMSSMPNFIIGLSGTTYATRATTAAVRSYSTFRNSRTPVLVDVGGESDLMVDLTAAQVLSAMESYHDAARAAGAVLTLACTVPPSTSYTAGQETQRQALNPLIKASAKFNVVADIAALAHAQNAADLTYYYDGIHPTAALAAEFADTIVASLLTIGVS